MDTKNVKGELQITDSDIKTHASDLIGKRDQMAQDLTIVHQKKPHYDKVMQQIADQTGTSMSSRVKNPKQIVRKTVQKRMEDRAYQLSDINDLLGYRFTVTKPEQEATVKKAIDQAAKQGAFVILKQQERDKADYHAYHYDIGFPIGTGKTIRGEIQVMDAYAEAQAAVSHDAHFAYGDNPPSHVQQKIQQQTKQVNQMPPIKAKVVANTLIDAHKQMDDNVLPKGTVDKVIKTVQNR